MDRTREGLRRGEMFAVSVTRLKEFIHLHASKFKCQQKCSAKKVVVHSMRKWYQAWSHR